MPVAILRTSVRASDPEQRKASTTGMETCNPVRNAQPLSQVLKDIFTPEVRIFSALARRRRTFPFPTSRCDVGPNGKSICLNVLCLPSAPGFLDRISVSKKIRIPNQSSVILFMSNQLGNQTVLKLRVFRAD